MYYISILWGSSRGRSWGRAGQPPPLGSTPPCQGRPGWDRVQDPDWTPRPTGSWLVGTGGRMGNGQVNWGVPGTLHCALRSLSPWQSVSSSMGICLDFLFPPPTMSLCLSLSHLCLPVSLSLVESLIHPYRREVRGGRGLGSQKDTSPTVSDPRWIH